MRLLRKRKNCAVESIFRSRRGQLSADVSVPLDKIPGGRGRYFNGSVTIEASLENGVLIANIADAEVNGESVPESLLEPLKRENLAAEMYKDPDTAKLLRKFERLEIKDGAIHLTPFNPIREGGE